jgi:hypothetical protein
MVQTPDDNQGHNANALRNRLIDVGLQDPFIRTIVGVVAIAVAASIAVSALGSGPKAIITIAFLLSFGVILVILRTIVTNIDQPFIKFVCFMSAGIIMLVFLSFVLFLIPAALICWPAPYAQFLGLTSCAVSSDHATCPLRPSVPGASALLIPPRSQKPASIATKPFLSRVSA